MPRKNRAKRLSEAAAKGKKRKSRKNSKPKRASAINHDGRFMTQSGGLNAGWHSMKGPVKGPSPVAGGAAHPSHDPDAPPAPLPPAVPPVLRPVLRMPAGKVQRCKCVCGVKFY